MSRFKPVLRRLGRELVAIWHEAPGAPGIALTAVGIGIGLAVAAGVTPLLGSLLFDVGYIDRLHAVLGRRRGASVRLPPKP